MAFIPVFHTQCLLIPSIKGVLYAPLIGSGVLQKLKQRQGPQPGSGSTTSSVYYPGQDIVFGNISISLSAA